MAAKRTAPAHSQQLGGGMAQQVKMVQRACGARPFTAIVRCYTATRRCILSNIDVHRGTLAMQQRNAGSCCGCVFQRWIRIELRHRITVPNRSKLKQRQSGQQAVIITLLPTKHYP
jgi:hypothetical protein